MEWAPLLKEKRPDCNQAKVEVVPTPPNHISGPDHGQQKPGRRRKKKEKTRRLGIIKKKKKKYNDIKRGGRGGGL